MKLKSILISLVLAAGGALGSQVQNVRATVDPDDRLVVNYDLTGSGAASIYLSVSEDGGENYDTPLAVSGDIGPGIAAGTGKRIVWDILADTPLLKSEKLVARVSTVAPDQLLALPLPKVKAKPGPAGKASPADDLIRRQARRPGPTGPSRLKLVAQSAVVPGWGQVKTGHKRGYLYLPVVAAGAAAAFWASGEYDDQKSKYYAALTAYKRTNQTPRQRAVHRDAMQKASDETDFFKMVNLAGTAAAAAVYGWNLIEMGTLDIGLSPSHAGLSVSVRF
jgi:hypothetical protein